MKKISVLFLLVMFLTNLMAQKTLLQSGPMLGYSEMREVLLWVQTKESATVKIAYWDATIKNAPKYYTAAKETTAPTAYTAKLIADKVQPDMKYNYELLINDKVVKLNYPTTFQSQPLWQWRKDPPAFTVALGSCAYINETEYDRPGKPYGSEYEIFETIHKKSPNMMLWLGDNTYLREADWFTQTGILHRYTATRSVPEMQALFASTHHYAIWDDHDFGPNDSDRSFVHKDKTLEAFKMFWGNPTYGVYDKKGITSQFLFHDIEFFLLDNRYHRTPNKRKTGKRTMLGEHQLEWLIDALSSSYSPFKMVAIGCQVLNSEAVGENYAIFPEERAYLLKRIEEEGIKGVVFLTGDRHHTELSKMETENGFVFYDLTISPLTAGVSNWGQKENNKWRIEGTLTSKHDFAILEFTGKRTEREMKIVVYDKDGNAQWDYTIKATEFK